MTNGETAYQVSYLRHQGKHKGILSWLLSTDHKKIALLYLYSITVFFFVAVIQIGQIFDYSVPIQYGVHT